MKPTGIGYLWHCLERKQAHTKATSSYAISKRIWTTWWRSSTQARREQHHSQTRTCCEGLQGASKVDTEMTANVLQNQKIPLVLRDEVTEKLEQIVREAETASRRHWCISRGVAEKKRRRYETLCVLEKAYQWQGHRWGLPNTRHGDNLYSKMCRSKP